jgi:hypothetical protein
VTNCPWKFWSVQYFNTHRKGNMIRMNHDKQIQAMINNRKGRDKRRCVTKHALQFM